MRYFIEFSYNGTNYHGWQNQPNAITVQEILEKSINTLLGSDIPLTGAGRTDTGVHAEQMFAHFDYKGELDENIIFRLNSLLPIDIAVKEIFPVQENAHARFDATERVYKYIVSREKNVFLNGLSYKYYYPLDLDKMNAACQILLGHTDFKCFSKSNTDVNTYYCKLNYAQWRRKDNVMEFYISADRFLRNMVRAIVGTLINIGADKITVADLEIILKSKDRSEAGYSVPAEGLYLSKINYPNTIKLNN